MYYFLKKYFLIKKNKLHNIFKLINKDDIIFDIGAHSGEKSKNLLKICSKLILVEPQPECVKILKKKFSDVSKVVILPCGISSKKEKLKLKINTSNPLISTFSDHWDKGRFSDSKWDKVINVDTTTLDQLINDYGHPKYIKIDVEGFELEVLKGLTKKTGILSFEFTSEFFKDAIKCLDYLSLLGYQKFNYSEGERKKFNFDWTSKDKILEEIENKIKINDLLWGDIYAQ